MELTPIERDSLQSCVSDGTPLPENKKNRESLRYWNNPITRLIDVIGGSWGIPLFKRKCCIDSCSKFREYLVAE